jgi:hypothetical protein
MIQYPRYEIDVFKKENKQTKTKETHMDLSIYITFTSRTKHAYGNQKMNTVFPLPIGCTEKGVWLM